jgi:hypothetical protein
VTTGVAASRTCLRQRIQKCKLKVWLFGLIFDGRLPCEGPGRPSALSAMDPRANDVGKGSGRSRYH